MYGDRKCYRFKNILNFLKNDRILKLYFEIMILVKYITIIS